MLKQRTLRNSIKAVGIGLHTGKNINMELIPAKVNTGINFIRTDVDENLVIPAIAENVGDTSLSTALVKDDVKISTIEHLLSAIAGLGVDNCVVKVDGPEVPIMDGSASPFVFLIQSAGIKEQTKPKKFIKIKKEISITTDNGAYAKLSPYDGFKVTHSLVYDDEARKGHSRTTTVDFNSTTYLKEISRSRTYGFMEELEALKKNSLALGASQKNAIAIKDNEILNEEGLRSKDELVKHKILDVIGDLYLLQHNLIGEFEGYKSGHTQNNLLLRKLIEVPDSWELISSESDNPIIDYIEPIIDPSLG